MDISGKPIWQQAAGDTDRDYAGLCLEWDVILNRPGERGAWPACATVLSSDCQIASNRDPRFASNRGSDSISMKFADRIALFFERNQHHANQFSDVRSRSGGSDCRKRRPTRRCYPCDRSGRYPGGEMSSLWFSVAARSQPVCSRSVGPAVLRSERTASGRDTPVLLRHLALPETDLRRTL